jgi:hypothetical protein
LGVSVQAIETFDENAVLHSSVHKEIPQLIRLVKEVIEYFKEEIAKRDKIIGELRS